MAAASRRSSSNGNESGSAEDRRRRKMWLLNTFQADLDVVSAVNVLGYLVYEPVPLGQGAPACRCYRCGDLLGFLTLTVDRIIPGKKGGTYRRNNIRPACGPCNFGHNRKVPS